MRKVYESILIAGVVLARATGIAQAADSALAYGIDRGQSHLNASNDLGGSPALRAWATGGPPAPISHSRGHRSAAGGGKIVSRQGAGVPRTSQDVFALGIDQSSLAAGRRASEIIPGNGSGAGYVLGHGNVVPNSESVYVGTRRGRRNVDYTIDYMGGSLYFTEPVRQVDSVRVDYEYSEGAANQAGGNGFGLLSLGVDGNVQMKMTYLRKPGEGMNAPDILTYGSSSTLKFGASSSLSGMLYIAKPQQGNRMAVTALVPSSKKAGPVVKEDNLLVQNADLGLGKVRLKLGFQDVGENFAGFAALRDSKAAPDDVLRQLEKEKGLKRMDLAGEIATGASGALSFSANRITDKEGDIASRAFGYSSAGLQFLYSAREVDSLFSRFKDIREADRAQLAAEAGMKRTNTLLKLRAGNGSDKNAPWNSFNMTRLQGNTGSLSYNSADLSFGNIAISADLRNMDPTFNKMTALSDEERARMALAVRRNFAPTAQIGEVSNDDRGKINGESGLNRANYLLRMDGGEIKTSLSLSSIESQRGSLTRTALSVQGSGFSLYFKRHGIDPTFDKLGSLQSIERAAFGNEYGMSRTAFGGALKLGFGDLAIDRSSVSDQAGAGLTRRMIDFKNPRLKLRANFLDIDSKFTRITDLSDADKSALVPDRGFKRADYVFNFQATKSINIDAYLLDAANSTVGETRGQNRYAITYTPQRGPAVTAFSDSFNYLSESGNLSSYSRKKITFKNKINLLGGLLFDGLSDVNTSREGSADPVTNEVSKTHLESDQNAPTSFTIDTSSVDSTTGQFEDTQAVAVKSKTMKSLSLTGQYVQTDRDASRPSEDLSAFGVEWAINNGLKMNAKMESRDSGANGFKRGQVFSLNGLLARRFLLLSNIKIASGVNAASSNGRQVGCDNAFKVEAGFLGGNFLFDNGDKLNPKTGINHTSRIFRYESDRNPAKWYHFTMFRQNLVTPQGIPARKHNYALDLNLSGRTKLTLNSYFGKDEKDGIVLPVGGSTLKISRALSEKITVTAEYAGDINEATSRSARVAGLGFAGTFSNNAVFEVFYGFSTLINGISNERDNVFRIKYDHRISPDHYITVTGQKKSGIEAGSINPDEGKTTATIEYRAVFN